MEPTDNSDSENVDCSDATLIAGGDFQTYGDKSALHLVGVDSLGLAINDFIDNSNVASLNQLVWTMRSDLNADGSKNGKFFVGGMFSQDNDSSVPTSLYKMDLCGNIDRTFNASGVGFSSVGDSLSNSPTVYSIALEQSADTGLPTRKILVGGIFTQYNGEDVPNYLIRLDSKTGQWDPSFNTNGAGFNERVNAIIQERGIDGSLTDHFLVGGSFTQFNGQAAKHLVRLNGSGQIITTFGNTFSNPISTIAQELNAAGYPTGKILVGGYFFPGLVRLNSNGTLDNSFGSDLRVEPNHIINELGTDGLPTGNILVAGNSFFNIANVIMVSQGIARLASDGTYDTSFNPGGIGAGDGVWAFAQERNEDGSLTGNLLLGGSFTTYNGVTVPRMIRTGSNGQLDTGFNASGYGPDGIVRTILDRAW